MPAVSRLTRISPATAVPSIVTISLAAGPVTTSSRWEDPTKKNRNVPLCTPTDIRSVILPAELSIAPISRSVRRMPTAARAPFAGWSSPVNSSNSASPPNLMRPPPFP